MKIISLMPSKCQVSGESIEYIVSGIEYRVKKEKEIQTKQYSFFI